MVAAEAEGQGEGQGQQAVVRRRADPFNITELVAGGDAGRGESVVNDILVVLEDEGEGARRMAVVGGPGQPTAPNVPAAAMKSILPEVRRKEKVKDRRGQPAAGAAGSRVSSVRTGGRGRTAKGGFGLVWFGSRPVPDALAHGQHSPLCRHDWARRIAVVRSQGLPDC